MTTTCDSCGHSLADSTYVSPTGRRLCSSCADSFLGLAAGALAGGNQVGPAVATQGWFRRLRRGRQ